MFNFGGYIFCCLCVKKSMYAYNESLVCYKIIYYRGTARGTKIVLVVYNAVPITTVNTPPPPYGGFVSGGLTPPPPPGGLSEKPVLWNPPGSSQCSH